MQNIYNFYYYIYLNFIFYANTNYFERLENGKILNNT